jgi:fructose/tagatose bisphosphate aldolase
MSANDNRKLVTAKIRFNRDNMRTFEAIIGMYEDSEDPAIVRVARTAGKAVAKALSEDAAFANRNLSK